ncbi:hypothetical protein CCM_08797 [Cordyceps militaris CM01]|uniref:Uncharacterized protein n=1 Tax=Cordyceps militaris (strain CM01) TaxID=983644 RepID=G3JSF9_CORMM|nr:uncharacterized protein CCM_08797 [Cordyceps militaris CM01]EGX88751.1 hypothetical protein CCM_08797 [Cordyceps militaris CM01]
MQDAMSQPTPVRMILRYRERPFQPLSPIIQAFFEWRDVQPGKDYSLRISSNSYSSPLYLILDLYSKTCPTVNLEEVDVEIFKVTGINPFTFLDLGEAARNRARQLSVSQEWGDANLFRQISGNNPGP